MSEVINRTIWLYTDHDSIIAFARQTDATDHLNKNGGRVRRIILNDILEE